MHDRQLPNPVYTDTSKALLLIKRFRITSESFIVFLISVQSLLFFMIPDRPLLSRISETAILSVTKLHTHVGPCPLVVHLIFFLDDPDYHSGSRAKSRILRFSSISLKVIIGSSFPVPLIVDLDKCYLSSSLT